MFINSVIIIVFSFCSQPDWLLIRLLTVLYSIFTDPSSLTYLNFYSLVLCSNCDRNFRSSDNLLFRCPSYTPEFVGSSFVVQFIFLWYEFILLMVLIYICIIHIYYMYKFVYIRIYNISEVSSDIVQ